MTVYEAVEALAALDVSSDLTDTELDAVEQVLRDHGIDAWKAYDLDRGPGRYGYTVNGRSWHYKLRQLRNRRGFGGLG